MDSAEFLLGTVMAVSSADGIQIKLDGQDEAMSKYYKMLITGANWPSVGDRVVIMKHSGTYVVMGKIGTPSQNAGKVNRGGDTMTGLLNINRESPGVIAKTTGRASSDTVATNTNSYGFRVVDKNGDVVALYTDRYETTGENGAFIGGYRMVNGTNTGNNLRLLVDAAGNKLVYVTSPAAWRSALNALNKSGDTMTGNLTFESGKELHVKAPFKSNDTYASNQYGQQILLLDSAGSPIGYLRNVAYSGGNETLDLIQHRTVNGESVYNTLQLIIGPNGARAVFVTDAAAWRKALGLGNASGALPITVAQGGTGATSAAGHAVFAGPNSSTAAAPSFRALVADDIPSLNASKITAGTLPIARGGTGNTGVVSETTIANVIDVASGFTIEYARYHVWGNLAMFYIGATATAAVTSNQWTAVGTLKSGKRPKDTQRINAMGNRETAIVSSGALQVWGTFQSGQKFEFSATYLLA